MRRSVPGGSKVFFDDVSTVTNPVLAGDGKVCRQSRGECVERKWTGVKFVVSRIEWRVDAVIDLEHGVPFFLKSGAGA